MKKILKEDYKKMVSKKEKSPFLKNLFFAFVIGGGICLIGQIIASALMNNGFEKEGASSLTSVTLIFLSGLLTGLGQYDNLAKHAGTGTLVPITGFANAIVSPAMEFKSEGFILGVGAKMFVIAGPVIVYGVATSVICGTIKFLIGGF
jgi:stage V sporulation protein AC